MTHAQSRESEAHTTRTTVQNAGWLLVQRGVHIAGGFLFAILIPRMMGPEIYGRYALVTSLAALITLVSALGLRQVVGRYVFPFFVAGDTESTRRLLGNLLTISLVSGFLGALFYWVVTVRWLPELDPLVLTVLACYVFVQALGNYVFTSFLGFNQAARWGLKNILSAWLFLVFLPLGFHFWGLVGACAGLLLTECTVLGMGVWWIRGYYRGVRLRLEFTYVWPYLQFGLVFFLSDVLSLSTRRSGEIMVRLVSGDYSQVGYYGVAINVYVIVQTLMPQLVLAFVPLLTSLSLRGETDKVARWSERVLKGMTIFSVALLFGVLLLGGDLVPLVFGASYSSVTSDLIPLTAALSFAALLSIGLLMATVFERPRLALIGAGISLATFWTLGVVLTRPLGALGTCIGMLCAVAAYACYITWQAQKFVRYSLREWLLACGLSIFFLPLVWLKSSLSGNAVLYLAFLGGYAGILLLSRVVTWTELLSLWQILRPARASAPGESIS